VFRLNGDCLGGKRLFHLEKVFLAGFWEKKKKKKKNHKNAQCFLLRY
jgi:hypothetical protein